MAQPKYKRQQFLLEFIRQLQSEVSPVELQKLIFLYTMDGHSDYYEFMPYRYGAYSLQLTEDIGFLRRDKYIHPTLQKYRLSIIISEPCFIRSQQKEIAF